MMAIIKKSHHSSGENTIPTAMMANYKVSWCGVWVFGLVAGCYAACGLCWPLGKTSPTARQNLDYNRHKPQNGDAIRGGNGHRLLVRVMAAVSHHGCCWPRSLSLWLSNSSTVCTLKFQPGTMVLRSLSPCKATSCCHEPLSGSPKAAMPSVMRMEGKLLLLLCAAR